MRLGFHQFSSFRLFLDGVEARSASVKGLPGIEIRRAARDRLLQAAAGEEQAVHRRSAHRREMPGALQKALLHPPREARLLNFVLCSSCSVIVFLC